MEYEGESEELLTIDGDPERTIKKKKSRRSHGASVGEALRMEDLASKLPTKKISEASTRRTSPDTGGTPRNVCFASPYSSTG